MIKGVAGRLGITVVPIESDEAGPTPQSLRAVHRTTPLRAVYLQPTLHNPLGVTIPEQRRADLADVLRQHDLYVIEDSIYAFLDPEPTPLAAYAPERTVVVDSLSRRLAPGLTLGFAAPPTAVTDRVAASLRSGTWTAPRFALDAATEWMTDGTAATMEHAKRRDAAARQQVARERLAGFAVQADPRAYHCWWELPEPWRAETFVAAAARRDIAVTPAAAFAIGSRHTPNAIRLALATPAIPTLSSALDTLATLARSTPEDTGIE